MDNYYAPGKWLVICDTCGFKFKSDQVRKRWDGLYVCEKDYETDHPQKYLRIKESGQAVPFIRHEPVDTFIPLCTFITKQAIPSIGLPGCMIPGFINTLPK